jgi:purine-binding chemotaxis protein CheW
MKSARREAPRALDWQQARKRLERLAAAAAGALRLSPEQARQVLEERARALARVPAAGPSAGEAIEVVVFTQGGEPYALETRYVREVVRLTDCTPLPGAPPFLVGVLNLRGELLAVLDLRSFLGFEGAGGERAWVLVLGAERAEFGLRVDAALEVRRLRLDEVLPPPDSGGPRRDHVRGVTAEALIVLDGGELLRDERLFIDQGDAEP